MNEKVCLTGSAARWVREVAVIMVVVAVCFCAQALMPSRAFAGCKDFQGAPQANLEDPQVKRVVEVWRGVFSPFYGMTGRDTGLIVLAADATHAGKDGPELFRPTAHICPGAPPVVYVTWPLVELVFGKGKEKGSYPEAFLAFVLAHELGHRINDLDAEGGLLGKAERASAGTGFGVEEMADKRAAFLAAAAGYSMRTLAREEIVKSFLTVELGLRAWTADTRDQMLLSTLRSFDAYEGLYDVAVAMTMSGEREVAIRLLARADELIAGDGVPLPEVKILRAIALMNAAAPHAPWREGLAGLTARDLRCAPVFATHTALWEESQEGAVRSGIDQNELIARAKARLELAGRLIDEAKPYGVSPLIIESATGCLALYNGDVKGAKVAFDAAKKEAGKKPPKALSEAFSHNLALAELVAFVVKNPAPPVSERSAAKKWGKSLGKLGKKVKGNAEVAAVVKRLTAYPSQKLPAPDAPKPGPMCTEDPGPIPAPEVPTSPTQDLGQCAEGFAFSHSLPQVGKTESKMGITTCTREVEGRAGAKDRYIRVRLPGAMEPALDPIDLVIMIRDFAPGSRPTRTQVACQCPNVVPEGVSDTGERAEVLVCPARGMITGVMMSTEDEQVTRLIVYEEAS